MSRLMSPGSNPAFFKASMASRACSGLSKTPTTVSRVRAIDRHLPDTVSCGPRKTPVGKGSDLMRCKVRSGLQKCDRTAERAAHAAIRACAGRYGNQHIRMSFGYVEKAFACI